MRKAMGMVWKHSLKIGVKDFPVILNGPGKEAASVN